MDKFIAQRVSTLVFYVSYILKQYKDIMSKHKIAIIGGGITGLTIACLLKQENFDVKVFEKFSNPTQIGASLLIQPSGLYVLSQLGIGDSLIENGGIIHSLIGMDYNSQHTVLNINYKHDKCHKQPQYQYFGIGIYRQYLLQKLYHSSQTLEVPIEFASKIIDIEQVANKVKIHNESNHNHEEYFDLVIDASGKNSYLRKKYAHITKDKQYEYGALWAMVNLSNTSFANSILAQRYMRTKNMIGILPIGNAGNMLQGSNWATAFFSMKKSNYSAWNSNYTNYQQWQSSIIKIWPAMQPIMQQLAGQAQYNFATYNDTVIKKYYNNRLVFIGDAAHSLSPQLGQGANLGIIDAWGLTNALKQFPDINQALEYYHNSRHKQNNFYQICSRLTTPLFQSDSVICHWLRYGLHVCNKSKYARTLNSKILCGIKNGLFSDINL